MHQPRLMRCQQPLSCLPVHTQRLLPGARRLLLPASQGPAIYVFHRDEDAPTRLADFIDIYYISGETLAPWLAPRVVRADACLPGPDRLDAAASALPCDRAARHRRQRRFPCPPAQLAQQDEPPEVLRHRLVGEPGRSSTRVYSCLQYITGTRGWPRGVIRRRHCGIISKSAQRCCLGDAVAVSLLPMALGEYWCGLATA